MTILSPDRPKGSRLGSDVTISWSNPDPNGTRSSTWQGALGRLIDRAYSDRRGSISRPKLLFTVSVADAVIIAAIAFVLQALTGSPRTITPEMGALALLLSLASM